MQRTELTDSKRSEEKMKEKQFSLLRGGPAQAFFSPSQSEIETKLEAHLQRTGFCCV